MQITIHTVESLVKIGLVLKNSKKALIIMHHKKHKY